MERECLEEKCDFEEAREIFQTREATVRRLQSFLPPRRRFKLEVEVDSPPKLQSGLNFCAGFFLITQRNKRESSSTSVSQMDKCTFVSVYGSGVAPQL